MIFAWILGLVISLVWLILAVDSYIKGYILILIAYYTIGLCIACYKAQKAGTAAVINNQLTEIAEKQTKDDLEIRKQLLYHIKYMQDLNTMVGTAMEEQERIKKAVLELTELLKSLTTDTNINETNNLEGDNKNNEEL